MRIRLFFSALALTLLLLLPMVGLVEYFAMQRQMQERVRRANAAGTAVQVDPTKQTHNSISGWAISRYPSEYKVTFA